MGMRRIESAWCLIFFTLLAWISLLIAAGCHGGSVSPTGATKQAGEARTETASLHDLSIDERAGGHTLSRHVGRSDAELRDRLRRERNIRAASTYTDRQTAESAVAMALADQQRRVERWLRSPSAPATLVLDYDAPGPVGHSLHRGEAESHPCSHGVVVLRSTVDNYYVLTSYPEC